MPNTPDERGRGCAIVNLPSIVGSRVGGRRPRHAYTGVGKMGIGFRGLFRNWAGPGIWDGQKEVLLARQPPQNSVYTEYSLSPLSLHELCVDSRAESRRKDCGCCSGVTLLLPYSLSPLSLHELCVHSSLTPIGQPSGVLLSSDKRQMFISDWPRLPNAPGFSRA